MVRKRPFVILEILIGLTLISIVFSFLFSAMSRTAKLEGKMQAARSILLQRQRIHTRLQDLFLSLGCGASLYTKHVPKESGTSLFALFDNGIDPDPSFSGLIQARIFLDEEKNLALALWPLACKKQTPLPWRKEILLNRVDAFQFQMLGKKQETSAHADAKTQVFATDSIWHEHWPENRPTPPDEIRLLINQDGVCIPFAFSLTQTAPLITYWKGVHAL